MGFKYSVVCDTLKWIGYDVLANPHEVLGAIKSAGYDGADLPGDLQASGPEDAQADCRLARSTGT